MAKILKLDPQQYFQGSVVLTRGDSWLIKGHIVDRVGGSDLAVASLDAMPCTGFLPAADPLAPLLAATGTVGCDGQVSFAYTAVQTIGAALLRDSGMYVAVLDTGGLQTIFTPDQPILIRDPGFNEF